MAHAKRCTVQLGVYDRNTKTLRNVGSGAILAGGRVLTCAHNVMDPFSEQSLVTESCTVLVATYAGDAAPARWAYEAEVLTPLSVLREKHEGQLLDLAVLQITSTVACDPPHCLGKAAVLPEPPESPQPQIEVTRERVGDAFFNGTPCLRCAPEYELRAGETRVTVIGYAAAAGSCIFADEQNVVNLAGGFLQTNAFVDTGSSGGPVINAAGDIVSVMSQGGGVSIGFVLELAKTRCVKFLRDDHAPQPRDVIESETRPSKIRRL